MTDRTQLLERRQTAVVDLAAIACRMARELGEPFRNPATEAALDRGKIQGRRLLFEALIRLSGDAEKDVLQRLLRADWNTGDDASQLWREIGEIANMEADELAEELG